ncbi:MAG: hypothetical protein IKP91_07400 [Bacteroidaceae bacterium]|nr:hypothetical protein [Bacteroidaceae bacterium]
MQKKTLKEFIEEARNVHGDKYDYSDVNYVNTKTKVLLHCPIHGAFWITPDKHINRAYGCPQCGIKRRVDGRRTTLEDFIARANKIHGGEYDYSRVVYTNSQTKVDIICPQHGIFSQTPDMHLSGHGCPKCAGRNITTDEFIKRAREVHGNKYDYSKVVYVSAIKKVCIICPVHGEFFQTPVAHFNNKQGCPKCSFPNKYMSIQEFLEKAKAIHGEKYDYSKVFFSFITRKVCFICHEKDSSGDEHGEFWQTPQSHLLGRGCPKCGRNRGAEKRKKPLSFFPVEEQQYIRNENDIENSFFPIKDSTFKNSKKEKGVIYKYVFPNGKVYVGQTTHPRSRHLAHFGKGGDRNITLYRAYVKYGMPKYNVLEKVERDTKEELREALNAMEQKYILEYKSNNKRFGYNLTSGGGVFVVNDEGRRHMSEARTDKRKVLQYDLQGNLVAEYDSSCDAAKALGTHASSIWACCKGVRSGGKKSQIVKGYTFRFKSNEDAPEKINLTITSPKKEVLQYDKEGFFLAEYESINEAARKTGVLESGIRQVLYGKVRQCGGYMWRLKDGEIIQKIDKIRPRQKRPFPKLSEAQKQRCKDVQKEKYGKHVLQYSPDGIFIKEFNSLADAAIEVNGNRKSKTGIISACKGIQKTAFGYVWRYKEEKGNA